MITGHLLWQRLRANQRGAVAITFAIFLVVGTGLFLFANDLARHNVINMRLQNSIDAALLSTASKYSSLQNNEDPDFALNADAQAFLNANFPDGYLEAAIDTKTLELGDDDTLSMRAKGSMNLWSGKLIPNDFEVFPLAAYNEVSLPGGAGAAGFDDNSFLECQGPGKGQVNKSPIFPKGTAVGDTGLVLFLNAYTDDAASSGANSFRDVFFQGSSHNTWSGDTQDLSKNKSCEIAGIRCSKPTTGNQGDKAIDPVIENKNGNVRLFASTGNKDTLKAIGSSGSSPASVASHYGKRLVFIFRSGTRKENQGNGKCRLDLSSEPAKGNSQLSLPIVDLQDNTYVRVAIYDFENNQGEASFYRAPMVKVFGKTPNYLGSTPLIGTQEYIQLDNQNYAHIQVADGRSINRLVVGTQDAPGPNNHFVIGSNILLGDGPTSSLRLSK